MAEEEKKIIVDDDWKERVQAEKEAAQQDPSEPPADGGAAGDPAAGGMGPMPPASFELLLTTLATEAMMSLGLMAHPATGEAHFQPEQAKYLIDMIEMLKEKTAGNLSSGEQQMVEDILHQLRMAYVGVTTQGPPAPEAGA